MENPMYTSQFSVFPNHFHQKHAKTTPFPSKRHLSNLLQKSQHFFVVLEDVSWRIEGSLINKVTSPHEVWQAVPLTQLRIEMVLRQSLLLGSWKTTWENPATDVLQTGGFVWFSWKISDREPVVFLFLVYKWFTLNDPPNFMSFTYFVGFMNKYVWIPNRLSLSWCVFCPQWLGENTSWQNLTDTGIFKAFGWPSKNEHFYTFLTLEEGKSSSTSVLVSR